jgi:hypothetical protein
VEKIKSFAEFSARKSQTTETVEKHFENEVELQQEDTLNEGFLDAIVRFFKGIFDLFNDKEVKKEAEASQTYFSEIENDEDIPDEDLEEELDIQRVRKTSDKLSVTIKKRIETDEEKGIRTSKNLVESLASWIGMILVQEEAVRMPLLSKMLENPELTKRFTWVPEKYTEANMKEWFSDKDCVLDKSIVTALKGLATAPSDKRKDAIIKFAENYVTYIAKKTGKEEGLKTKDKETLDSIHLGFAKMASNILSGINTIIKNTKDDKLSEVIAGEIITARKRKGSKKPGQKPEEKKPEDKEDDSTTSGRSRKGTKKTATAPTDKTAPAKPADKTAPAKAAEKPAAKTGTTKTTTKKEA